MSVLLCFFFLFFFNDTATTEIYTLSLHDALPIYACAHRPHRAHSCGLCRGAGSRSEEHTSELQSHSDIVCRLLLEKKKNKNYNHVHPVTDNSKRNPNTLTAPV